MLLLLCLGDVSFEEVVDRCPTARLANLFEGPSLVCGESRADFLKGQQSGDDGVEQRENCHGRAIAWKRSYKQVNLSYVMISSRNFFEGLQIVKNQDMAYVRFQELLKRVKSTFYHDDL